MYVLCHTDGLKKRNTWIAALIYVSKKEGKLSFSLYIKECSFVSNTYKKCPIKMN